MGEDGRLAVELATWSIDAAGGEFARWTCNTTVSHARYGAAMTDYRLYFRGATILPEQRHDAILSSDGGARELAVKMLAEQTAYPCAEVWDRARLVCTVRRNE
jgi:hypothetical protein